MSQAHDLVILPPQPNPPPYFNSLSPLKAPTINTSISLHLNPSFTGVTDFEFANYTIYMLLVLHILVVLRIVKLE